MTPDPFHGEISRTNTRLQLRTHPTPHTPLGTLWREAARTLSLSLLGTKYKHKSNGQEKECSKQIVFLMVLKKTLFKMYLTYVDAFHKSPKRRSKT